MVKITFPTSGFIGIHTEQVNDRAVLQYMAVHIPQPNRYIYVSFTISGWGLSGPSDTGLKNIVK